MCSKSVAYTLYAPWLQRLGLHLRLFFFIKSYLLFALEFVFVFVFVFLHLLFVTMLQIIPMPWLVAPSKTPKDLNPSKLYFTVIAMGQMFSDTKSVSTSKVPNGSKVL